MSSTNNCCSGCDSEIMSRAPELRFHSGVPIRCVMFYRDHAKNASDFCKSHLFTFLMVRNCSQRFLGIFGSRAGRLLIARVSLKLQSPAGGPFALWNDRTFLVAHRGNRLWVTLVRLRLVLTCMWPGQPLPAQTAKSSGWVMLTHKLYRL